MTNTNDNVFHRADDNPLKRRIKKVGATNGRYPTRV